jgi:predicted lysophospholipase L1 biosynthesis ABC-type transport system permease subunit
VRSFPTTEPGLPFVILPVQALTERFLQILQPPNGGVFSVLAMGGQDPAPSVQRAGLRVVHTFSAARIEALLASSQQNLAIGMEFAAGVAGVSLAVLVLSLALYFGGRRREYEFSSLRAMGGRPRHAATALAIEYGLVLAASLGLGFVIGAGLLSLIITLVTPPVTTTAAIPRVLIDWPGLLIAAAVAVAAWGVGLLLALGQARRVSATAVLRGEPE